MADSNVVLAYKYVGGLTATTINYGVNLIKFNKPNAKFPYSTLKVHRNLSGWPSTAPSSGELCTLDADPKLYVMVNATSDTGGGFTVGSFSGGGTIKVAGTWVTIGSTSWGAGGAPTLSISSYPSGYTQDTVVTATSGYGTATIRTEFKTYNGTTWLLSSTTVVSSSQAFQPSESYNLSILGKTLTVTVGTVSYPTNASYTYTYTDPTKGASFRITRSTSTGQNLIPVTNVEVLSGGSGYLLSDTVSVAYSNIDDVSGAPTVSGGTSASLTITCGAPTSAVLGKISTFTYGSGITDSWATFTKTISNMDLVDGVYEVPATTVVGTGNGASFTVTISSGAVSSVVLLNSGSGYINKGANATAASLLVLPLTDALAEQPSEVSVYDIGTSTAELSFNEYVQGVTSDYLQGVEAFYSIVATYPAVVGTNLVDVKDIIGKASVCSPADNGMFNWLKAHIPSTYWALDTGDLEDFIKLIAFHLDCYKGKASGVFNKYNLMTSNYLLLRQLLKEFGSPLWSSADESSARRVADRIVEFYSKKGSENGVETLLESHLNASSIAIGTSPNILLTVNDAEFETSLGGWSVNRRTYSGSTMIGTATPDGFYLNGFTSNLDPSIFGTNRLSFVDAVGTATITLGYKEFKTDSLTATPAGSLYINIDVLGEIPLVGDYVIGDYFPIGTKITSIDLGAGTLSIDKATLAQVPVSTFIAFSTYSKDKHEVLSELVPVTGSTDYYMYEWGTGDASKVRQGIIWYDSKGTYLGYSEQDPPHTTVSPVGYDSYFKVGGGTHVALTSPALAKYARPFLTIVSGSVSIGAVQLAEAAGLEYASPMEVSVSADYPETYSDSLVSSVVNELAGSFSYTNSAYDSAKVSKFNDVIADVRLVMKLRDLTTLSEAADVGSFTAKVKSADRLYSGKQIVIWNADDYQVLTLSTDSETPYVEGSTDLIFNSSLSVGYNANDLIAEPVIELHVTLDDTFTGRLVVGDAVTFLIDNPVGANYLIVQNVPVVAVTSAYSFVVDIYNVGLQYGTTYSKLSYDETLNGTSVFWSSNDDLALNSFATGLVGVELTPIP